MTYKYAIKTTEKMAKAVGLSIPISRKKTIEICNWIRKETLENAKKKLEKAVLSEIPVPYKRFNKNIGHKPGMTAGRYPAKTCFEILKMLKSAEANAQNKGLNQSNLIIKHIIAQQTSPVYKHGRKGKRKAKSVHLEVVLEEVNLIKENKK